MMRIYRREKVSGVFDLVVIYITLLVVLSNIFWMQYIPKNVIGNLIIFIPGFGLLFWFLTTRKVELR